MSLKTATLFVLPGQLIALFTHLLASLEIASQQLSVCSIMADKISLALFFVVLFSKQKGK